MSELDKIRKAVPHVQNGNVFISEASRCSFPTVLEFAKSKKYPDSPEEASIMLLFPKNSPMIEPLVAEIKKQLLSKTAGKVPHKWRNPLRKDTDFDLEKYPEYTGHWVLKLKRSPDKRVPKEHWSSQLPLILDRNHHQILDPSEIYAGSVVRAKFEIFGYNNDNGAGVSTKLHVVQKIADMESFSGTPQNVSMEMPDLELPDLGGGSGEADDSGSSADPFEGF